MQTVSVFVCFDWENDRHYKRLLEAWDGSPEFEFVFADSATDGIGSDDIPGMKAALTAAIGSTTHTLVVIGRHANQAHPEAGRIGSINWMNFEIHQSKANGNHLAAVRLDRTFEAPDELRDAGAVWAVGFTQQAILKALREAG